MSIAILDGPLALENAISMKAARVKKIVSPVACRANVLASPTSKPAKSLSFRSSPAYSDWLGRQEPHLNRKLG